MEQLQDMIRLEHIWLSFEETQVLKDVSLSVKRGNFLR